MVSNLPAPDGLHGLGPISLTIDSVRQISPGGGQILVGAKGGWESWLETTAASSPAGHFPTPFLLEARAAAADCWFGKVRVSPPCALNVFENWKAYGHKCLLRVLPLTGSAVMHLGWDGLFREADGS